MGEEDVGLAAPEVADFHSKVKKTRKEIAWDSYLVPTLLVVLLVAFGLLNDNFLTKSNLLNVLEQVSVLGIVAAGMTVVIISGGFDLSVGSNLALSGAVTAIVMSHVGIVPGIVAGLLVGGVIGLINGIVISRMGVSPFIATLGMLVVARGLALGATGGSSVYDLPEAFGWLGTGRLLGLPVPAIIAALVYVVCLIVVKSMAFGLKVYAIGGNREAARLSGIKVVRVQTITYVICGVLAAVAGIVLAARLRAGEPTVGVTMELYAIAAVVLGGASLQGGEGYLTRTILGVLFIGVLQNGLNLLNVAFYWQQVLIGFVFIGASILVMIRRSRTSS